MQILYKRVGKHLQVRGDGFFHGKGDIQKAPRNVLMLPKKERPQVQPMQQNSCQCSPNTREYSCYRLRVFIRAVLSISAQLHLPSPGPGHDLHRLCHIHLCWRMNHQSSAGIWGHDTFLSGWMCRGWDAPWASGITSPVIKGPMWGFIFLVYLRK